MSKQYLLLTIDEAAEELRMSPGYVKKAIREGHIRKVKLGTAVRVEYAEIVRYIAAQRVGEPVGTTCNYAQAPAVPGFVYPTDSTMEDSW